MKCKTPFSWVFAGLLLSGVSAWADQAKFKVDTSNGDQDTAIIVHKGPANGLLNPLSPPEYQLTTETDEITGYPIADQQAAYASWDKECKEWKADLRKDNGKRFFKASCGKAHMERDPKTFLKTYSSEGTYQINVPLYRHAAGSSSTD